MGVQSISGARTADSWPSGGRKTVVVGSAAAGGWAEPGGTTRSRPGTTTTAGQRTAWGRSSPPATRHKPWPGFVIAIPRTRAGACHLDSQRHSVVDPVLEGDKTTSVVAFGIEGSEPDQFAFCRKRIEEKEQGLDGLDRYTADRTAAAREVIGSEGQGLSPPVFGVKNPRGSRAAQDRRLRVGDATPTRARVSSPCNNLQPRSDRPRSALRLRKRLRADHRCSRPNRNGAPDCRELANR
jgi:hypothetical protein